MNWEQMWDILLEEFGVSEETLRIVTDINGCSEETMEDILYTVSGYRSFDQAGYYDELEDEEIEGVGAVMWEYAIQELREAGVRLNENYFALRGSELDELSRVMKKFGYRQSKASGASGRSARQSFYYAIQRHV